MLIKYPESGDCFNSNLYPGQVCKVLYVEDALVTFEWLGQYDHIDPQSAPVNRFIQDFSLESNP